MAEIYFNFLIYGFTFLVWSEKDPGYSLFFRFVSSIPILFHLQQKLKGTKNFSVNVMQHSASGIANLVAAATQQRKKLSLLLSIIKLYFLYVILLRDLYQSHCYPFS